MVESGEWSPHISWVRPPSKGSGNVCLISCLLLVCVCLFTCYGCLMNEGYFSCQDKDSRGPSVFSTSACKLYGKRILLVVISDDKFLDHLVEGEECSPYITPSGVSSAPEPGRIQGRSFNSQVGIQAATLGSCRIAKLFNDAEPGLPS